MTIQRTLEDYEAADCSAEEKNESSTLAETTRRTSTSSTPTDDSTEDNQHCPKRTKLCH